MMHLPLQVLQKKEAGDVCVNLYGITSSSPYSS